jgi:hypothetical protein
MSTNKIYEELQELVQKYNIQITCAAQPYTSFSFRREPLERFTDVPNIIFIDYIDLITPYNK